MENCFSIVVGILFLVLGGYLILGVGTTGAIIGGVVCLIIGAILSGIVFIFFDGDIFG